MWLILQQEKAEDFVIATGVSSSLADFLNIAFHVVGLNWEEHVVVDPNMLRPSDLAYSKGNS